MASQDLNVAIPKTNDFDQDTARKLLRAGGTLVVDNFPTGSEFGIDLSIHYTGERFIGVKMIPAGVHFIHYSLVGADGRVAPRCGFFHCFSKGELLVARWDAQSEDIVMVTEPGQIDRTKFAFDRGQLDNRLGKCETIRVLLISYKYFVVFTGAYQFSTYDTWVSLTDYITTGLATRLNPSGGRIYSASSLVYEPNEDGTVTPKVDRQGVPDMVQSPDTRIRYYSQPPKHFLYPANATPREISEHSMDSSYTLNEMLKLRDGQWTILLGEMQFSFIVFLLGHQFEAFEFWRDMVRLLCHGATALKQHRDLYLAFVRVIYFQLKQTNEAIFADIVENENVIFQSLRRLVENVRETSSDGLDAQLVSRVEGLAKSLAKSMKWPLDEVGHIPDDELPSVVLLDDS